MRLPPLLVYYTLLLVSFSYCNGKKWFAVEYFSESTLLLQDGKCIFIGNSTSNNLDNRNYFKVEYDNTTPNRGTISGCIDPNCETCTSVAVKDYGVFGVQSMGITFTNIQVYDQFPPTKPGKFHVYYAKSSMCGGEVDYVVVYHKMDCQGQQQKCNSTSGYYSIKSQCHAPVVYENTNTGLSGGAIIGVLTVMAAAIIGIVAGALYYFKKRFPLQQIQILQLDDDDEYDQNDVLLEEGER